MRTEQDIEQDVTSVPARAKTLTITTNEEFERAGELLKVIKGLRAEVDSTFDGIISKAHEAHKEAISQKRRYEAPLAEAEALLKPKLSKFLMDQERERQQEQLRQQKAAQEQAEREAIENAIVLDDMGETAAANQLLEEPVIPAPVFIPREKPKVSGIVEQKRYSAQVVSLQLLVKAVAEGKVPMMALKADTVFLNQQARSMKDTLNYPGVRLVVESNISARKA
jgi:hypothetical protein